MSLRSIRAVLLTGGVSIAFALGACGGDVSVPNDAGISDAGNDSGTGRDATVQNDAGAPGPVTCGGEVCSGVVVIGTDVDPCCLPNDTCGIRGDQVPGGLYTECVEQDVEPASMSSYCGAFFDQLDTIAGNGLVDVPSAELQISLSFPACCLPSGECGAYLRMPQGLSLFDLHLGCVSYKVLAAAAERASDGGVPSAETPAYLPFCNPADGAPPTTGTVPGVPKFVCGCGVDQVQQEGGFPCLSHLPVEVCGADEPSSEELAAVPAFLCGCEGAVDPKLGCLANLPSTTCGGFSLSESSAAVTAVLSQVPEFVCGCGEEALDSGYGTLCMSNVPSQVCGTSNTVVNDRGTPETDDDCLVGVPEYAHGCGDKASDSKCLIGAEDLPGCEEVPAAAAGPVIARVPAFFCGCEGSSFTSLGCLMNVQAAACGAAPVLAGSPYLASVPEYFCGCEGSENAPVGCLPNVESSVCGAAPVADGASPLLAQLPEYLCGCGEQNVQGSGTADAALPCLSNVDNTFCGAVPIPVSAAVSAAIVNQLCGCGDGVTTTAALCLDNVPPSVCGAKAGCTSDDNFTSSQGSCGAGQICLDAFGGSGASAGGMGGAGDGIGDTCFDPG